MRCALLILFLAGCSSHSFMDGEISNFYLKKIKSDSAEIQWYYHSLVTSTPPDWVVIKYNSGLVDTICQAGNIQDVVIRSRDTILITFISIPEKYSSPTIVKTESRHFNIEIDTNGIALTPEEHFKIRSRMTFKDTPLAQD